MSTQPTAAQLLAELAEIGRDPVRGGYTRPVFSAAERQLRDWFIDQAQARGLDVEIDGNGIVWAWWDAVGTSRAQAIATGSHLDSVPGGGAYDGPLGVVSALAAIDELRARGVQPKRAIAAVVFPEEERSRFGLACLGSRLASGASTPQQVRELRDADGHTYAELAVAAGEDPALIGPDPERLGQLAAFVELHVEQGRGLADLDQPVAIGRAILGHGRWHFSITGRGDHAGTTVMADRHDPVVVAAQIILAARTEALAAEGARATVGRVEVIPGGTNVIASRVELRLDVRHRDEAVCASIVAAVTRAAEAAADAEGCQVQVVTESESPTVVFDEALRTELEAVLPQAPVLDTGAGHDAGVLSAVLPTAMLFVRNPTGTSHSPLESAVDADVDAGARALADVLQRLVTQEAPPQSI
ncbi:allantoate amidohydrolase [Pseudoclavibacter soli]|uniref:allantoate amidohydrolase n=1 Tax=Pseudoclavibacter soli TaxID=452623 RepID=UPI0003FD3A05|nr:allantoate amidohydrolase [Pseudoclavibacter soli]